MKIVHSYEPTIPWPDPEKEMGLRPEFEAVWQAIKDWDIAVPAAYSGYSGATGNHARAILDALDASDGPLMEENKKLRTALETIRWIEGINPTAYKIAIEALRR